MFLFLVESEPRKPTMRLDSTLIQKAQAMLMERMLSDVDLTEFEDLYWIDSKLWCKIIKIISIQSI